MSQIKIVNVEDYAPSREATSELLRLAGFAVFEAPTGNEALQLVAQVKPQLVLLDVKLPDISGHEVCRRLKANDPATLILQISASLVSGPDKVRGLESGADAYLVKPVEPEELIATIKALLRIREAEEARRETEQRYELLFESSTLPTWLCDLDSFEFLAVNQAAVKQYGYRREEFLTMSIRDIQPAEDVPAVERYIARLQDAAIPNASEWRHQKKDGTIIDVEVIWQELLYQGRRAALVLANDITDRKRAEEEREQLLGKEQKAREQAEAANRAKDEFLATVSHELRAPLNAMLGWAQILRSTRVDDKTLSHAIEIIERSARTQSRLIEDLLDTARIVSGKLRLDIQPVDLTSLIENAVDVLRPASEGKEIELELNLNAGREVITGDPDRLQQVVWNLLSNAIKFTPKRGHVEVRLERADPHVRVTVSDTGKGISPDYLPFIFDRFHQADSSSTRRSGLGLGLSLVRHLVELHGGTVYAKSPGEGKGASFIIDLPLRAVLPQSSEGEPPVFGGVGVLGAPPLGGVWVLVVDDEVDARELVATLLQQCGAKVTSVGSAQEALAVITAGEEGTRPDVVVSDVSMPEVDGYELMRRVRELAPESGGGIPAVALTAYGRSIDRIRALSAGFQMHMPKPVEPAELATVVASLTGLASKSRGA